MSAADDRSRQAHAEALTNMRNVASRAVECAKQLEATSTSPWRGQVVAAAEQLRWHLEWLEREEAKAEELKP